MMAGKQADWTDGQSLTDRQETRDKRTEGQGLKGPWQQREGGQCEAAGPGAAWRGAESPLGHPPPHHLSSHKSQEMILAASTACLSRGTLSHFPRWVGARLGGLQGESPWRGAAAPGFLPASRINLSCSFPSTSLIRCHHCSR